MIVRRSYLINFVSPRCDADCQICSRRRLYPHSGGACYTRTHCTCNLFQATFLHVVPPIVLFLAKHPLVSKFDLSSVQEAFTGAAPVGRKTMEEAVARLERCRFRQGNVFYCCLSLRHHRTLTADSVRTLPCHVCKICRHSYCQQKNWQMLRL